MLRTRLLRSRQAADRRTQCCICWRLRVKRRLTQDDDFQKVSERTPVLADFEALGSFCSRGYASRGRDRLLAQRLLQGKLLHENAKTVTGASIGAEAAKAKETPGQEVIARLDKPLKKTGGLVILKGNIAPEGCVAKISGHERLNSVARRGFSVGRRGDGGGHGKENSGWRRRRHSQ